MIGWRSPTQFSQLVDFPDSAESHFRKFFPEFEVSLLDLETMDLDLRPLKDNLLLLILLKVLRFPNSKNPTKALREAIQAIAELNENPRDLDCLRRYLTYLFHTGNEIDYSELLLQIETIQEPQKSHAMTFAEQLIEKEKARASTKVCSKVNKRA